MSPRLRVVLALALVALALRPEAAAPTRVMLLDGESGGPWHKWQQTTPVLKKVLDETGLFQVDVVTAPPANGDFAAFAPKFGDYKAVVLNYDAPDDRWPAALKTGFEQYVSGGGGVVVVHAADNAFPAWKAYNDMIGIGGWRGRTETAGPYWFVQDGKLTSDPSPGSAGAHGARVPFTISVRDATHPITKGLPAAWMHQGDELYSKLRRPGTHDRSGNGAFRSRQCRIGTRRTDDDGPIVRKRAHLPHDARSRHQWDELRGIRHDPAAGTVGGHGRRHAARARGVPDRDHGQLPDGYRVDGPEFRQGSQRLGPVVAAALAAVNVPVTPATSILPLRSPVSIGVPLKTRVYSCPW